MRPVVKVVYFTFRGLFGDNPRAIYEGLLARGNAGLEHTWLCTARTQHTFPAGVDTILYGTPEAAAPRAARAEPEAQAREAARPKFVLPINGARYTGCFCSRWGTFHWGIALAAPMRTPEYAAGDGVVLRAGAASGFGLAVYILHENGDVTVYGHMDEILVEPGQYVEAGETIALLGNRGQSTGPHLHFEVHQGGEDGKRIDPVAWLNERGVDVPGA